MREPRVPASNLPSRRRSRSALATWLSRPRDVVRLLTRRDAPLAPKLVALFALAYVFVPLDLVPDLVPVFGWLDDLGVVSIAAAYVLTQAARFAERDALLAPHPA